MPNLAKFTFWMTLTGGFTAVLVQTVHQINSLPGAWTAAKSWTVAETALIALGAWLMRGPIDAYKKAQEDSATVSTTATASVTTTPH